jgi:hypothetical protein
MHGEKSGMAFVFLVGARSNIGVCILHFIKVYIVGLKK